MSQEMTGDDRRPPEEEPLPYPEVAPLVCFLTQTNWPRRWCLEVTWNSWWNYVSTTVVLLNCASMVWYDPCKGRGSALEVLDYLFFAFFLVEMIMKVVALGLLGNEKSYLINNWNKLDLLILFVELLGFILKFIDIDISWLQDFVRPQRVISRISSMLLFVKMLLETLPMFGNVLLLCNFILLIFSVVSVQMWAGCLRNRCFLGVDVTKYNLSLPPFYSNSGPLPFTCSPPNKSGMLRCWHIPPYVQNGTTCLVSPHDQVSSSHHDLMPLLDPEDCYDWNDFYNVCRHSDENPYMGAINFDNIGYAWISVFQVVTLEGWSEIMYMVMDVFSFWSFTFFVFVTIIGSFVVMNVCAVVIAAQFSESMEKKKQNQNSGPTSVQKVLCWLKGICERLTSFLASLPWCQKMANFPIRPKVQRLVVNTYFQRTVKLSVFLSVVSVAVEHDMQPPELTEFIWISNIIFTLIFTVEMVLKLIAHTREYFRDQNNILEFLIVIASICELRTCTRFSSLLQLMRLILFVPYLKNQLLLLKKTIQEVATLCGLILLFIFTFSVLGMHLFGCTSKFKGDRKNFNTLLWAMVTVFQLLTQEDWNFVMYNGMAATTPWASLYFVAVIVLGRHLLLNVLVSIVVQGFKLKKESDDITSPLHNNFLKRDMHAKIVGGIQKLKLQTLKKGTTKVTDMANPGANPTVTALGQSTNGSTSVNAMDGSDENTTAVTEGQNNNTEPKPTWIQKCIPSWCKEHEDWSLFVFSPNNRFRAFCQRLTSHKKFDRCILFFTALTCVTIAAERPNIKLGSVERYVLDWSGYFFACIFLVEMVLKIIALGLLVGKDAYCRSPWNLMDGVLVILFVMHTVVEMASSEENNLEEILKPLRLLRTLCPLRVLKRVPRLKQAVEGVISSLKSIGCVFAISCVFFSFYGILGVQLFKGKFYNCVDKTSNDIRNVTNKTQCLDSNYHWVRRRFNFDSLPQALMALFVMYSQDGWLSIMYDGLDAVAEDTEPVTNYSQWRLIYFLSFMMVSFLLLDMFISILVEKYAEVQKIQKEHKKSFVLKQSKKKNQNEAPVSEEVPYYTHYSPLRRSIHSLCTNPKLDFFMMVIIALSMMIMGLGHYKQPQYVEEIIEHSFFVTTAFLVLEVTLKMVAFGAKRYLQNSWNRLDIVVVLVSVVSTVFAELNMTDTFPINPSILRVSRVLRLAQVLKAKRIRVLVKTITKTLLKVGNLCLLFIFFFYIYAVLGVELFGDLECSEAYPCVGLHRHANFRNFGIALMALFKVTTGDNWNGILRDALRECHPDDEDCVDYLFWAAPLVLITFVIMVHFLLVNLVVSSIIQALEDSNQNKTTQTPIHRGQTEDANICAKNQPTPSTSEYIHHKNSEETNL